MSRGDDPIRAKILEAAFTAFMENGYAATTTLDIATRAQVSKRELYALVGKKADMLAACIEQRARRLSLPVYAVPPRDRDSLAGQLEGYGESFLSELTDPAVIAVFRLAIAEAERAPEVARTLDRVGREASRNALREILARAHAAGLISADPALVAEQLTALLWGEILFGLLLRIAARPTAKQIEQRARQAAAAVMRLYAT